MVNLYAHEIVHKAFKLGISTAVAVLRYRQEGVHSQGIRRVTLKSNETIVFRSCAFPQESPNNAQLPTFCGQSKKRKPHANAKLN